MRATVKGPKCPNTESLGLFKLGFVAVVLGTYLVFGYLDRAKVATDRLSDSI